MKLVSTNLTNLVALEQHSHRFVIALLHWHKVSELGGDKLHRPPVVALTGHHLKGQLDESNSSSHETLVSKIQNRIDMDSIQYPWYHVK